MTAGPQASVYYPDSCLEGLVICQDSQKEVGLEVASKQRSDE